MTNLKQLNEQRNSLFEESDKILSNIEKENRSVNSSEEKQLNKIKSNILDLNTTIEALESKNEGQSMEERSMENDNKNLVEKRAGMEQFLRREAGEERAQYVNTTGDGKAIIPTNIASEIIEEMESVSNIFGQARRFSSVKGELRIPRDSSKDQAGFVGENEEVTSIRTKFDFVKLGQRRVGAAITLTNQLVNDAGFDIVQFSINKLATQTARAVEKAAIHGTSDNDQFEGILSPKSLALEGLNKVTLPAEVTYNDLVDIYNSVQPVYLDGSQWIMSRALFGKLTQLQDGNGHKYVQGGMVNGRLQQTLLGLPVVVSDQLAESDGIIFGKISEAYGIMVKTDFQLQYVSGDTQQAANGTQLLVFDGYMDGNVINPEALVVAQSSVTP